MKQLSNPAIKRIKTALFLICLAPLARLVYEGTGDGLGANPIEAAIRSTGFWTLTWLQTTLAVTPLRKACGWQWLTRLRRTIALFAFFYGCLHLAAYLVLDQSFDWAEIAKDIAKRPYITVGFATFALLVPLAVTSTDGMVKRLGGRRWQHLHRLAYLAGIGGVVHYFWLVKRDITLPAVFAVILAILLCARMAQPAKRRRTKPAAEIPPSAPVLAAMGATPPDGPAAGNLDHPEGGVP
jgi:sulfoxide reductase heme-binding subunit YedZ